VLKFHEMPYIRPNMKEYESKFDNLFTLFKNAKTYVEQDNIMKEITDLRTDFETMAELANIRYTIDTKDKFYEEEKKFYDENMPIYEGIKSRFNRILVNSNFRKQLEQKWGKQIFTLAELSLKTFKPEIIEDLQLENKLTTDYVTLLASAKIMFEGEERNLSQMVPFQQSRDRSIRKSAYEARYNFFTENEDKLDKIYDDLVTVRTKIAEKLGFSNFIELAYARMGRSDYDAEMVSNFRKQVLKYIVPVSNKLKERQKKRLGLDKFMYYDDKYDFKNGNALPKGTPEYILSCGKKMYSELSPETDEFFQLHDSK
jgi:M3 family oligoendopeptidase